MIRTPFGFSKGFLETHSAFSRSWMFPSGAGWSWLARDYRRLYCFQRHPGLWARKARRPCSRLSHRNRSRYRLFRYFPTDRNAPDDGLRHELTLRWRIRPRSLCLAKELRPGFLQDGVQALRLGCNGYPSHCETSLGRKQCNRKLRVADPMVGRGVGTSASAQLRRIIQVREGGWFGST